MRRICWKLRISRPSGEKDDGQRDFRHHKNAPQTAAAQAVGRAAAGLAQKFAGGMTGGMHGRNQGGDHHGGKTKNGSEGKHRQVDVHAGEPWHIRRREMNQYL